MLAMSVLHEFLTLHRTELIDRCRLKVAERRSPKVTDAEITHGIPLFLGQLIKTLKVEQTSEPMRSRAVSGPAGGAIPAFSEIGTGAALHGRELLSLGFSVDQVVHDYGDLCQAITDLAVERGVPIETNEFRTLNRCLDNGIADAMTEYAYQRNAVVEEQDAKAMNERLGVLAHELRNLVQTATLAVSALKTGNVGLNGATGAVLDRSLIGLRSLIDRSLADVRVTAGLPPRHRLLSLARFVAEIEISASLEARARGCHFTVTHVDPTLSVDADPDMLLSAVGNLLQNAFKFTKPDTSVLLSVHAVGERILIEVEDHCGGLPPGFANGMSLPFIQSGEDRSGLGLGLAICRRSIEANGGALKVRDAPGTGCGFTLELPRHQNAPRSTSSHEPDPGRTPH
jgi:signal transduction histidine kinase